jgi:hypothetical protein
MRFWIGAGLAALPLAACEPDGAQLAEAGLVNRPAAKIRACFGRPDQRMRAGVEEIWVYRVGRLRVEGWLAAYGADERPTFSAPNGDCEARFTLDRYGVKGVAYTATEGRALPQGEACEIDVKRCLAGGS